MIRFHNRRIFSFFFAMMLVFFSIVGWLINPIQAFAQDTKKDSSVKTVSTEFGPASTIADYLKLIMDWAIPILGVLGVLMITYAGYLYITSQGNPESVGRAKEIIIGVIIGYAFLFLMGLLLRNILGIF